MAATRPVSSAAHRKVATVLRFASVGAVTTCLDFALFSIAIGIGTAPVAANIGSYSCGIVVSYLLNRSFTFRVAGSSAQAARFVAITLAGLALSTLLVAMLAHFMLPLFAKIVSVPLVFLWNYLMAQHWVFRTERHRVKPVADRFS